MSVKRSHFMCSLHLDRLAIPFLAIFETKLRRCSHVGSASANAQRPVYLALSGRRVSKAWMVTHAIYIYFSNFLAPKRSGDIRGNCVHLRLPYRLSERAIHAANRYWWKEIHHFQQVQKRKFVAVHVGSLYFGITSNISQRWLLHKLLAHLNMVRKHEAHAEWRVRCEVCRENLSYIRCTGIPELK